MRLNRYSKCFFPVESKYCMKSASYEYRKMSARRGHNSYPLECQLSAERLFRQKRREYCQLETQASWWCHLQSAPSQNMFLRALIPKSCIYGYRFWKWRCFRWYWWVCLSISGEVWLYKEWKNQKTWCLCHGWKLEISDVLIPPLNSWGFTSDWSNFWSRLFRNTSEDLAWYV